MKKCKFINVMFILGAFNCGFLEQFICDPSEFILSKRCIKYNKKAFKDPVTTADSYVLV